ncbi:hypothetical protein, partial [Flavobacterium phycosphaerae]|uniref:hypothetical protein n=1 Tax=Flavobacterium phycosphaerae TaxID=2697515 RepID=UPI00138AE8D5
MILLILRRDLFHKTADTPVIAIIAQNIVSTHQDIEHVVVNEWFHRKRKSGLKLITTISIKYLGVGQLIENKKFIWK